MRTLYVSAAVAAMLFVLGAVLYSPVAGIFPAVLGFVAVGLGIFLNRRKQVDAAILPLTGLLEQQKVDEAIALIRSIQAKHGPWVPGLDGQLNAQLGLFEYMQQRWDAALPLLMEGRWRNPLALLCIGAIHLRRKEESKAFEFMREAEDAANKDPNVYVVHAVFHARRGDRPEALKILARGAEACENTKPIERVQRVVANGKRIDPEKLPEMWMQVWPEDLIARMRRMGYGLPGGPPVPGAGNRRSRRRQ